MFQKIRNLFKKKLLLNTPFSEHKAIYDFLTLHLAQMEEDAINENRNIAKDEWYKKMKKTQEKTYDIMLRSVRNHSM
ncbi:MAG: Unknown protein [uncultured Aureispira sp.]|uniref:Uncharacterized protein n=1 Tax=uncultured Aureispira sp. TaxID=1331704 RepID=A0A6S6UBV5_9BACT|nr:MAG: Unknown protein [uncultured Aureispira sp.]